MNMKLLLALLIFVVAIPAIYGSQCNITSILVSPSTDIGDTGAVKINVVTNDSHAIVGARCTIYGYTTGGLPLTFGPNDEVGYKRTDGAGDVGFSQVLSEFQWKLNTTYVYKLNCYCPDNTSIKNLDYMPCFDNTTGNSLNFLSCTSQQNFTFGQNNNIDPEQFKGILVYLFGLLAFFIIFSLWFYSMQHALTYVFMISSLLVMTVITWFAARYVEIVNAPWASIYWRFFNLMLIIMVFVFLSLTLHWMDMFKEFKMKKERDKSKALFGEKFG